MSDEKQEVQQDKDGIYVRLTEKEIVRTEEICDHPLVLIDYDKDSKIIGIEILKK
jgi:uncharacterized protein YuzE